MKNINTNHKQGSVNAQMDFYYGCKSVQNVPRYICKISDQDVSMVWGLFVPERFVPGLFVPLSYKMLGINYLAGKNLRNPVLIKEHLIYLTRFLLVKNYFINPTSN